MRLLSVFRCCVLLLVLVGGSLAGGAAPQLLQTVPNPQPLPAEPGDKAAEARWLEAERGRRPAGKGASVVPGPVVARDLVKPSELVGGPSALFANLGVPGSQARRIVRIGRDGKVQVLAEGRRSASALTVGGDGQVYWREEDTVVSVPQKGGKPRAVVRFAHAEPTSLAERDGTLYAAVRPRGSEGGNGAVVAIDKKGQVRPLAPGEGGPGNVTVDALRLFWTSQRQLRSMPLRGGLTMSHGVEVRAPLVPHEEYVFAPGLGSRDFVWVEADGDVWGVAVRNAGVDSLVKHEEAFFFTSVSVPGVVRRWEASAEPGAGLETVARFQGERGLLGLVGNQLHLLVVETPGGLGTLYRVEPPKP